MPASKLANFNQMENMQDADNSLYRRYTEEYQQIELAIDSPRTSDLNFQAYDQHSRQQFLHDESMNHGMISLRNENINNIMQQMSLEREMAAE